MSDKFLHTTKFWKHFQNAVTKLHWKSMREGFLVKGTCIKSFRWNLWMDKKVESTSSRLCRPKIPFWKQCLKKSGFFCLLLSCYCSKLFHYGSVHCHQKYLICRQRQGHRDGSASTLVWLSRQHQSFLVSLESMIFLVRFPLYQSLSS